MMMEDTFGYIIMLISRLYIPADQASTVNLHEVNMPRLGRLVVISGKNGAGKTRLLNLLEQVVARRSAALLNIENYRQNIRDIEPLIQGSGAENSVVNSWRESVNSSRREISNAVDYVIADESSIFGVIRFVPTGLKLADPMTMTPSFAKDSFNKTNESLIKDYPNLCLAYIQQSQNRWWNSTHQNSSLLYEEKQSELNSYNKLNELIMSMLGHKLDRSINDEATIFGMPIAHANLSDGQKISLQLAVALHAQGSKLDNTVFILDELENHLHPSVAIDLLTRLISVAPNAQFWISTHSIPLLAYVLSVDPMALWYMEDGNVTHAGRHPERVLMSLLGDEERIGQLRNLADLPALLAMCNYAAESLLPPKVLPATELDPQLNQISKILNDLSSGKPLRVLDYGAGKGRLLEGLAALNSKGRVADHIDYYAYDPFPSDRLICEGIIGGHYGNAVGRYLGSEADFFSQVDDSSVDVIVMCNVLHEINPKEWLSLISKEESLIMRALSEEGYLLIVEDQNIPTGEKAHEHGFLVFDTPQLKTLFSVKTADSALFVKDTKRQGRLTAHLIGKPLLRRMTIETRLKSIRELRDAAMKEVKRIRSQDDSSYAAGQLHGFWTQQFANASMWLSENDRV